MKKGRDPSYPHESSTKIFLGLNKVMNFPWNKSSLHWVGWNHITNTKENDSFFEIRQDFHAASRLWTFSNINEQSLTLDLESRIR